MIRDVYGDLFDADVEAIVNPVNTAGVMGKGLALRFKQLFPENYAAYRQACEAGEVVLGRVFPVSTGQLMNPRWVLNFPTKGHWRSKSRLADIDSGLAHLRQLVDELGITSVAVPALGCGLGGLDWSDVAQLIIKQLGDLPANVLVFPPGAAKVPTLDDENPDADSELADTERSAEPRSSLGDIEERGDGSAGKEG